MNTPPRKEQESGLYAPVWRKINQLIDYMREISVVNGREVRVSRTMNGTMLLGTAKGKDAPPVEGTLRRLLVTDFSDDYVTCDEIGAVAKPFRLTKTPFHGQSITFTDEQARQYTAVYTYYSSHRRKVVVTTGGVNSVSENQVIVPRYVPGLDFIYVMESADATGVADANGVAVTWVDINADGRAWARER